MSNECECASCVIEDMQEQFAKEQEAELLDERFEAELEHKKMLRLKALRDYQVIDGIEAESYLVRNGSNTRDHMEKLKDLCALWLSRCDDKQTKEVRM